MVDQSLLRVFEDRVPRSDILYTRPHGAFATESTNMFAMSPPVCGQSVVEETERLQQSPNSADVHGSLNGQAQAIAAKRPSHSFRSSRNDGAEWRNVFVAEWKRQQNLQFHHAVSKHIGEKAARSVVVANRLSSAP